MKKIELDLHNKTARYAGLGLVIGALFGSILGAFIDNWGVGLLLGGGVGIVLGPGVLLAIDTQSNRETEL